jgi:5-oxoprolinase (ATP-hydrolysing) subunit A
MLRVQLDLNADVGEGLIEVDAALMPLITSANIACGLHAGNAESMAWTVALAVHHGVAVGAHPGFDDREGFGRRAQNLSPEQVKALVLYQLGALDAIAREAGATLHHVKPHGALYNQAEADRSMADAIATAIRAFDPTLRLVGRAGSAMQDAAAALGHPFTPEAFADRRYRPDGSLTPRSQAGAVLTPDEAAAQVHRLVTEGETIASDGTRLRIAFETLCLHGDTPGAASIAVRIRQELDASGVTVSAPRLLGIDTLPP